jgi:predicted glycosyltransferase
MGSSATSATRILLYSHDSWGLGHLRRSLNLARRLVESIPGANALIATGSPCATSFALPPGVDLIKLPTVGKGEDGHYVPRQLSGPIEGLRDLRKHLLEALWDHYRPELLVVDHQVIGLLGEAVGLLERARRDGARAILGVRDVIDSPERVAAEWGHPQVRWALREGYDRVCVYGSPQVFDARANYPFPPELGERLEYVGYVVRPEAHAGPAALPELEPEVLVTTGGGEDGELRIAAYLEALAERPAPWTSTLVLGPMLSLDAERRLRLKAQGLPRLEWHRFLPDLPQRMARADGVVAMAGYNTVAELLAGNARALLMPRRFPRREQELRAAAFERLGLFQVADESSPRLLRRGLDQLVAGQRTRPSARIPLDGVDGLTRVARELLGLPAEVPAALRSERQRPIEVRA